MTEDDLPIVVFQGEHSDAVFLVSLLESEGIDVTVEKNFMGVAFAGNQRLLVRRRDAQRTARIVEIFRRNS